MTYKKKRIPQSLRARVCIEKGGICGLCHKPIKFGQPYDVDHIYPEVRHGQTEFDNLHCAHVRCNRKKK
jgi:5-methylcytosine-specific restriction endonuclease McrA